MHCEDDRIVVYPSLPRFIFNTLLFFLLLIVSVFLIFTSLNIKIRSVQLGICGLICSIIFSYCAYYFAKRIITGKPSLDVDSKGIYYNSPFTGDGFLKWDNIKEISLINDRFQLMIGIKVKNKRDFCDEITILGKLVTKFNSIFKYPEVYIPQSQVKRPITEIYSEICVYRKNKAK